MSTKFQICHKFTKHWEGGWFNHPKDPGGATNHGITIHNFRRYKKFGTTVSQLMRLTKSQAALIHKAQKWVPVRAEQMPLPIAQMVYDEAVHSGVRQAALDLQQALNVLGSGIKTDKQIGPVTLAAIKSVAVNDLVRELFAQREGLFESLYRNKPHLIAFKNGWTNRLNDLEDVVRDQVAELDTVPKLDTIPREEGLFPKVPGKNRTELGFIAGIVELGRQYVQDSNIEISPIMLMIILFIVAMLVDRIYRAYRKTRVSQTVGDHIETVDLIIGDNFTRSNDMDPYAEKEYYVQ